MSDPLHPPPLRPAPLSLRERIGSELEAAPRIEPRRRAMLLSVAAAALVITTALGITSLTGRPTLTPAQPASPPPATSSTGPTPSTSPTTTPIPAAPKPPPSIDVRRMTKAQIAADIRSCHKRPTPDDNTPRRGTPRLVYAAVQNAAGVTGPIDEPVRVLLMRDDAGTWECENGESRGWTSEMDLGKPTAGVPVVEVENYGSFNGSCAKNPVVSGNELYTVGPSVVTARMRFLRGGERGAWQTTTPIDGLAHFRFQLRGADTKSRSTSVQFQFLDSRGKVLRLQPYGEAGTPTATSQKTEVSTCADMEDRGRPPAKIKPPTSDTAGIKACRSMAKTADADSDIQVDGSWKATLVVSTKNEWGAVLSNGSRRFGCSLFPTREISRPALDWDMVRARDFFFALNPIPSADGATLWAAGRMPKDVTAIDYRLPGGQQVAAEINPAGYWMLMYTEPDGDLAEGNVEDRDPVVVTVTRPSGPTTFRLEFDEKTMCNQISHGC